MYRDEEKLVDGVVSDSASSSSSTPTSQCGQSAMMKSYGRHARRRLLRPAVVGLCLIAVLLRVAVFVYYSAHDRVSSFPPPPNLEVAIDTTRTQVARFNASDPKLHLLISARDADVDLCRTLLTSAILGYPSPTILGRGKGSGRGRSIRFPRISHVLTYLSSLKSDQDDNLVLLVDGHNVQFQLPLEVLVARYFGIIDDANARLNSSFGNGNGTTGISQGVIFAADKRCASAAAQEELCYPAPPSPAADDLYGDYTDTASGANDWFHYRQKYVNPGFVIGPAGTMRKIFERAQQIAIANRKGSRLAGTSEQAVFAKIYSEQERWRETQRSVEARGFNRWLSTSDAQLKGDEGARSSHTMEKLDPHSNYEFGIAVDYFSEMGHSTLNSDVGRDGQFIVWNDDDYTDFHEQVNAQNERDVKLDCPVDIPNAPPDELLYSAPPFHLLEFRDFAKGSTLRHSTATTYNGPGWDSVPLYAHLCFGTVPVMIHHNSEEQQKKNEAWDKIWLTPRSEALLQMRRERTEKLGLNMDVDDWSEFKEKPAFKSAGGAWSDDGKWSEWWDICPFEKYGAALFHRDL